MTHPSRTCYDAIVVGTRCAGAATAMLLARAGLRVLAIDRAAPDKDPVSTHALMRGGVVQLKRWGLLEAVRTAGTPAIRTTTFHYGDDALDIPIKPRDGVNALFAPRRTLLDPILVDAARHAGAEVHHGVSVVDLLRAPGGRVRGVVVRHAAGETEEIRADVVIGADGLSSTVARLVGAPVERVGRFGSAVVYGYFADPGFEGYHWYYRPRIAAGLIPTNDGRACIFVAAPRSRFTADVLHDPPLGHRKLLAEAAPDLATRLVSASRVGPMRPFAGRPGLLRRSRGPGWALVGDAGFFKDPLTAHGITDALRDAEIVARTISAGTDRAFIDAQRARDALAIGLLDISDEIASFEWDLDTVARHHRTVNALMREELALIAGFTHETIAA
jgi:menaquinone-9 beta-reductase